MPFNTRKTNKLFRRVAERTAKVMGDPIAFATALVVTLLWLAAGPFFQFNEGWNFAANSSTTVITFLMLFLVQNSQNREARIASLERQAILKAIASVPNTMIGLHDDDDDRLDELEAELKEVRQEADQCDRADSDG
ncbi:low affinity iron permease family protein [Phormidium sp. FACHB-592]|uniref:Low affinity iron permease family protein n=1 Tax=Stenomitos frigidus AS-A4 TaxID=2933935 RepID=A0ABV0KEP4_9CYAN|nr:low affinity iron permease family protein [Phormidium sp. FACHB-592]MBD2076308.1 low affinity iron permease family protein [Phormidium sp. FACHB-592]